MPGEFFLVLCLAAGCAAQSAADDYRRGMEFARLNRWEDARRSLEAGWRKAPRDERFPLELAGVAFRQQKYSEAKAMLRAALRLDPADAYACDFAGTLYFLDGNFEAALKFWNRAGRPMVRDILREPEPRLSPLLVERSFAFSRASLLRLSEYLETRARLDQLDVFPSYRLDLLPADDQAFDVSFRSVERRGKLAAALSLLRGAPYQTLTPEVSDLGGSGVNVASLFRWDSQKRRAFASVSGPLARDPKRRYRLYLDGRNENWNVTSAGWRFNLRQARGGAEIRSVVNGAWSWKTGVEVSESRFHGAPFLSGGTSLKYLAGFEHDLLRIPEWRLRLASRGSTEVGRLFGSASFSKMEGALDGAWFPQARGDDYEIRARLRAGKTFGEPPFDELFILGVERDTGLWLRGHAGTLQGQKGSAPLGRDYALVNCDVSKTLLDLALVKIQAGPFLDGGQIRDRSPGLGSKLWMWDAGLAVRLRILGGLSVTVSYGRDLRTGGHALFATTSP